MTEASNPGKSLDGTTGPLHIGHTKNGLNLVSDGNERVATISFNDEANALRLAASWNACQGISTEDLESGGTFIRMYGRASKQRDRYKQIINRLIELVSAAFYRGWKDGSRTGKSDSPDWNAGEDWCETSIRCELLKIEEEVEEGTETVGDIKKTGVDELVQVMELATIYIEDGATVTALEKLNAAIAKFKEAAL
jgi:hypothetical protein